MTEEKTNTPTAFKLALVNLIVGATGLINTLVFTSVTKGFGEVFLGLLLLGLGEYINNPQYSIPPPPNQQSTRSSYFSRRRNVSSLGNLLDIAGVLMIFIGGATLFF